MDEITARQNVTGHFNSLKNGAVKQAVYQIKYWKENVFRLTLVW